MLPHPACLLRIEACVPGEFPCLCCFLCSGSEPRWQFCVLGGLYLPVSRTPRKPRTSFVTSLTPHVPACLPRPDFRSCRLSAAMAAFLRTAARRSLAAARTVRPAAQPTWSVAARPAAVARTAMPSIQAMQVRNYGPAEEDEEPRFLEMVKLNFDKAAVRCAAVTVISATDVAPQDRVRAWTFLT